MLRLEMVCVDSLSLHLSLSSWLSLGSGWGWGCSGSGAGWGKLWSQAEGRYGSISVALLWEVFSAIINHVREGRGMLIPPQLLYPVCQVANSEHESRKLYSMRQKKRHLVPQQQQCEIRFIISLLCELCGCKRLNKVCGPEPLLALYTQPHAYTRKSLPNLK